MRDITVSFGKGDKAAITTVAAYPWEQFAAALTAVPPEVTDKAARGWYIPATFDAPQRHGDNFVHRDAITLDFDHVSIDDWGKVQHALKDIAFAMYTTYSHTDTAPRFRVVVPLSRPCGADEFEATARRIAEDVGIELVARESFVPPQMMYMPARKLGGAYESYINPGPPADVDAILAGYSDWTDRTEWPRRADGDEPSTGARSDPREKPGIIGEFCRRFNVAEAIQCFDLPYTPTPNPKRYTYTLGSVKEGAVIYDDAQKFHSHHDTDPARGQNNAFDLVRLHRYGSLDVDTDPNTPVTDRPSYRAMVDMVRGRPEFQPAAADEFVDLSTTEVSVNDATTQAAGAVPSAAARFPVVAAQDFTSGRPMDWLVRNVLPRAELVVVYGESGSGKSFLALDLSAAISRGIEWRTRRVSPGRVVYVCAEGASGFKARLRAYARGHNVELSTLPAIVPEAPNLLEQADAVALCQSIVRWGSVDVIIIDTLSAATPGGNENSGESVGLAIAHCKFLHRKTGALVILIHHSGKDAAKGARGWSGLRAAADAEIEVTRNGDYRRATLTKMKDGGDLEAFDFKLKVVSLGTDMDGEEESSCIVEHVDSAPVHTEKKVQLKGLPKLVHDTLSIMAPSGTCAVEDLIEGVKTKLPKPDGRDIRRQNINIAITRSLIPAGLAFMQGEDRIGLTDIIQQEDASWE